MIDSEKRAHDLAILYMQLEIKEGQINISEKEDIKGFLDEYDHLRQKFSLILDER